MNFLKDLIQRCHQRHAKPLQQRKTVAVPSMYTKGHLYRYSVYCAHKYSVLLDDLEAADISFMPIGRAPENDRGPRHFGGELFRRRTRSENWGFRRWDTSWGIQVYTGIPSEREGARWHDFNFTYQALCAAPDAVLTCIEALLSTIANPLLTLSKSGGLRFSCRIPDYLHQDTEKEKLYIYKHTPTPENPQQRDVYLEILGEKGYSRWDARYEILLGDLLAPPVIVKEALFAPINALRAVLHQPAPKDIKRTPTIPAAPLRLGSYQLDLAKEAFMKRGFSYVRRDNGIHYWIPSADREIDDAYVSKEIDDVEVSLWEDKGIVWIRAASPDVGVPTTPTPITDIWDDTGIVPSLPKTGLPIADKVLAVREGLSPLSIKRAPAILQKAESTEKVHEIEEKNAIQMRRVLEGSTRIRGLMLPGTGAGNNYETELSLLNNTAIHLNMSTSMLAKEAEHLFQAQNVGSVVHWKDRMHLWDQVKDIPINVRMEFPFQHGNVCEDPERCDALVEKGGNPSESICPECAVYTECQDRGYLSQPITLQRAKAQVSTIPNLFFNPQYANVVDEMLKPVDETERLCIINMRTAPEVFPKCMILIGILEAWGVNWQGEALGNFAKTLLNALQIKGKLHRDAVKGVRAAIRSFEWQEEELIRQMCQVNVRGRVVEHGVVDTETGKELARQSIAFEGGASAYIPLDDNAADRLMAKGLPFFRLDSCVMDEDIKIPVGMTEAIRLGIFDASTVESIQELPTVYSDPNWTFWHQLKRFFAHYTRDADAPIRWDGEGLHFWVPPVPHPRAKRLLVTSSTLSDGHLRRAFPEEEIEVFRMGPTAPVSGNQVFQIRTGIYPRETLLDYDSTWDVIGVSKIGQRILLGIRAEIERDPNVKHAIITDSAIIQPMRDITAKENVCFLKGFQEMINVDMSSFHEIKTEELQTAFQASDIIWIVGAPERPQSLIWRRAQMLFGNHEELLSYEIEAGSNDYINERLQSVYEQEVVSILTEVIKSARLNHTTGKKVVLLTALRLPYITDRSETLLFDWEDFEIAGGLDKLPEVIATRQRFETERDNLTVESGRKRVEQVLGCSSRQANRFLYKLRGGRMRPLSLRQQILSLLTSGGEMKTAQLVEAIQGHPDAIKHELKNLVDANEITKVRRAVYALKTEHNGTDIREKIHT